MTVDVKSVFPKLDVAMNMSILANAPVVEALNSILLIEYCNTTK